MKKAFVIATAALALTTPVLSFAQFGSLLGGKTSSSNSGTDLNAQQDQMARSYVTAGQAILTAQGHLAGALGLNTEAIDKAATANSISASDIDAQDKAISASATAIAEAQKSGAQLKDTAAKEKYAKGLLSLAVGLKKYTDMSKGVQDFTSGLKGASPMMLPKLQAGVYIVKSLPTNVSNLTGVLKNAVDFAKTNGVEVPADATSIL